MIRVFLTTDRYRADHYVFLVSSDSEQANHQLISPGVLVSSEGQADVTVFIVDYEYDATIKITRGNFPKSR